MKADFRLNCGALVLALMRKGIAPRWSGLVAFRGRGLIDSLDCEEKGNDMDANSVCRDLRLWDLVWLHFDELESSRFRAGFSLRDDSFDRLVISCLERQRYLSEAEAVRGLGCNVVLRRELQTKIEKLENGNGKKIKGIDAEIREIESLITMKASVERKKLIAETRALRRFAYRVGCLARTRTRLAACADVYEMMSGEAVARSNLCRDLKDLDGRK